MADGIEQLSGILPWETAEELQRQVLVSQAEVGRLGDVVQRTHGPVIYGITAIYAASGAMFIWALLGGLHLSVAQ